MKLLLILLFSNSILAATLDGVSMEDEISLAGTKLILNGQGTRKATWLKVKVYVSGLYAPKKASSYEQLIKLTGPKQIRMDFVRDVTKDQIVDGWNEAFSDAYGTNHKFKKDLILLNKTMSNLKKSEQMIFNFFDDRVEYKVKKEKYIIKSSHFSKSLFSIWFKNAKDTGLMNGLLGIN